MAARDVRGTVMVEFNARAEDEQSRSHIVGELAEFHRKSLELQNRAQRLHDTLKCVDVGALAPDLAQAITEAAQLLDEVRQKLAKGAQLVSAVFEGALDAFVFTDHEYRFVEVNNATTILYARPKEQLIGRAGSDFAAPGYDKAKSRRAFLSAGRLVDEIQLLRPDGEVRDVEFAVNAHVLPGLNFGVMRDVTERKRLEEQLGHKHKMQAVGALAGGIAHDFNNLLSVILGYAELTLSELNLADPLRENLEEMRQAGRRAEQLTRQLLTFGRGQIVRTKLVDLNEVVAGVESLLGRVIGEHIALTCLPDPALWTVLADRGQIEQVIVNLVLNARDAMPEGGSLTIQTTNVELDTAYAERHVDVRPGSYAMLAVTDTGMGMTKAVLARIFEPFFSTKHEGRGTGLGLATVFGIVNQSGGHIWVSSEPGVGSTFKVYLPRAASNDIASAESIAPGSEPASSAAGGTETVLLVEDDDQLRLLARTVLQRSGYVVLEARNAGEAFLICESHSATIHLLLTDVVMPIMSGPKLAERLLSMRPELKVLYISGYTGNSVLQRAVLRPEAAFLEKPLMPTALLRKVRAVLDGITA